MQQTLLPSLVLQPYIEYAIWNSLSATGINKVLLDIKLLAQNKIV